MKWLIGEYDYSVWRLKDDKKVYLQARLLPWQQLALF